MIEARHVEEHLVLRLLESRLDVASSQRFRDTTRRLTRAQPTASIVLDLASVTFVDSSGLSALILLYKTLGRRGTCRLCNVDPNVRSVLRITRIDQAIPIFDSLEEALAHRTRPHLRLVKG